VGGLTVLAIVAAVILSAIPSAAARPQAQAADGSSRLITVVGSGSASAAPDLATLQIGVDTANASPELATSQNQEQMASLIEALKAAGIAEKDIQTAYYNMYAEQRYDPATNQPTGEFIYHVSNSLSVKTRDLANVGALLVDAVNAGANNISGVYFSIEDTAALEAEAREKAVADAKARAQSLAGLSDVELGEIVVVSEVINSGIGPIIYDRAGQGGGGGAPIQPGQLEVSMQVQVSFAIK
jgi:uncharacterized protein YggE